LASSTHHFLQRYNSGAGAGKFRVHLLKGIRYEPILTTRPPHMHWIQVVINPKCPVFISGVMDWADVGGVVLLNPDHSVRSCGNVHEALQKSNHAGK